jgi:tetratricopeptide (TPR) repeat protein
LRLAPDDASIIGTQAFVYLRLNRPDDAIASYDAALKHNPKIAFWLYGRGLAKLRKGDATGGNADLAAAEAIQSDLASVYAKYGLKTR